MIVSSIELNKYEKVVLVNLFGLNIESYQRFAVHLELYHDMLHFVRKFKLERKKFFYLQHYCH